MTHKTGHSHGEPAGATTESLNDLQIVSGYRHLLIDRALDSLAALFDVPGAEVLEKSGLEPWRERLRLTLVHQGRPQTFYLKRYRRPPVAARRGVRRCGWGASSVAGVEWLAMRTLAELGIPTIKPVAFGEELSAGREIRSAILTAAVPGDALERVVAGWDKADRATVRRLIFATADLVSRLHGLGFIHRDLYLSHIFYDAGSPPDQALHLIDLQRVIRPRWRRGRWIVKDLASLNYSAPARWVSRADRVRWLHRYLGMSKLDSCGKRLVRRVARKTKRIARHDRRRSERFQTGSQPGVEAREGGVGVGMAGRMARRVGDFDAADDCPPS